MTASTSAAIRYGHMFVNGEDRYLFVNHLARGAQSHVQLVVKVSGPIGELLIRKVTMYRLKSSVLPYEDNELMAVLHLQEQAQKADLQPNIISIYSFQDVESSPVPTCHSRCIHRVSYMRYYNGGSLTQLFESYKSRGQIVPRPLIRHLVWQVTQSLHFMYSLDRHVLHYDLEMRNIFVNFEDNSNVLDFYIGDFGSAVIGPFTSDSVDSLRDIQSLHRIVIRFLKCPSNAISLEPSEDEFESLLQNWISKLHRLTFPESPYSRSTVIPDLTELLDDMNALPAPVPRIRRVPAGLSLPLCHDTREEALNVRRVHGPWYVAEVWNDNTTRLPEIVGVDESRTYHRPNLGNSESDTDDAL